MDNAKHITEATHGDDEKAILDDIGLNWLRVQEQTDHYEQYTDIRTSLLAAEGYRRSASRLTTTMARSFLSNDIQCVVSI